MSAPKALVELSVAAPAGQVWAALRDPVLIDRWFGWDAPSLAEEIQYIFVQHAREKDGRLIYFEGMPDSFEVEDRGGRSVVRLLRDGAAGDDSDWDGPNEDMTEGWLAFLTQLKFYLERHAGQARRTLYLNGAPPAGGPLPRALLGLPDDVRVGAPYALALANGEGLTGFVWARSRRQYALTADAYGDGLVLVTDRSVGTGSVLITAYGLDDDAFAGLKARWQALLGPGYTVTDAGTAA